MRAWTTAVIVTAQCDVNPADLKQETALYEADLHTLLQVIRKQADAVDSLILFGHNPGLTELANDLCEYEFENIPTSGLVGIRFETNTWLNVGNGMQGELLFFDYPKKFQDS